MTNSNAANASTLDTTNPAGMIYDPAKLLGANATRKLYDVAQSVDYRLHRGEVFTRLQCQVVEGMEDRAYGIHIVLHKADGTAVTLLSYKLIDAAIVALETLVCYSMLSGSML